MSAFLNLLLFIIMIAIIAILALFKMGVQTTSIRRKIRNAKKPPWDLHEFLILNPSKQKVNEYYKFHEGNVRSHAFRYVGRFDTAILHWEDVPVLDLVIERKFPVSYLPERARKEDIFQSGLYALALEETGVTCRDTRLVIIYCLQDVAKRCFDGNSTRTCENCGEGKFYSERYNKGEVLRYLNRINEVWYKKRKPRANPSEANCRPCPFSKNGKCNYSSV